MKQPLVIINFKTYEQGIGSKAAALAKICNEFGTWVCPQPTDIAACAQTGATTLAQHIDAVGYGSHTGSILPEAVKAAGAVGSLINHAEKKLSDQEVGERVARLKELGMTSVVCAESLERAHALTQFKPDYIALELPELIGGDVSIVSAEPGIVQRAVHELGDNVLVGAGVSSGEDLKLAVEQGAAGVLLASAVVKKTDDPRAALNELYSAL